MCWNLNWDTDYVNDVAHPQKFQRQCVSLVYIFKVRYLSDYYNRDKLEEAAAIVWQVIGQPFYGWVYWDCYPICRERFLIDVKQFSNYRIITGCRKNILYWLQTGHIKTIFDEIVHCKFFQWIILISQRAGKELICTRMKREKFHQLGLLYNYLSCCRLLFHLFNPTENIIDR